MEWLPGAAISGGPWLILLSVVTTVFILFIKGVFVTGAEVDRTIAGYVATNTMLEKELTYWRQSCQEKDQIIRAQAEHVYKLMRPGAVALEAIAGEAKQREVA